MTEKNQEPQVEETKVQEVAEAEEAVKANDVDVAEDGTAVAKKQNKFVASLDSFFQISARKSTIRTEVVGGLTTFFAMCYILLVNPAQMSGASSGSLWNAIFIGTAIGAIIGTLLMALLAKMPFAQAPGMGLNSFFFVSFMLGGIGGAAAFSNEAYQAGMSVIFIAGVLFLIISLTPIREKIAKAIPTSLKKAISAGIGLFIALIGMKNAGLIQFNPYTFVQFSNFAIGQSNAFLDTAATTMTVFYQTVTWYSITPALVSFIGLMVICILKKTKVGFLNKGNVVIGILLATGLYYLFNIGNSSAYTVFTNGLANPGTAFVDWANIGAGAPFFGFKYWTADVALNIVLLIITFCLIDMFDTLGTLQGTAAEADMLDENGVPIRLRQCLLCDSIATVAGGVVGTSTVTTFVESASGVSAGARTGFSSVIVAFMFFIAMFLSPIASIVPSAAVSCALVYVGILMMSNVKDIDFKDITMALPSFLIIFMMPFTYSISNGIGIGLIAYSIIKFFTVMFSGKEGIKEYYKAGKGEDGKFVFGEFLSRDLLILLISILFVLRFFLVSM